MSKLGAISYSLYLVHWPVFAFTNNAWIGENGSEPPVVVRVGLIVLSLVLAYLLHHFVEEPLRRKSVVPSFRMAGIALLLAGVLVFLAHGPLATNPVKDYAAVRRINHGFGAACEFKANFEPISECRNSDAPEILVWGDSYAMHIVPGLLGANGSPPQLVQATMSVCGPLLGISYVGVGTAVNPNWAESCIAFNDSVIAYLSTTPSIRYVVLSSPFGQYLNVGNRLLKRASAQGAPEYVDAGLNEAIEGVKRTAATVRALGKRVVIVAPPPSGGFDIGRCLERYESNLVTFGVPPGCAIRMAAYRIKQEKILPFLAAVQRGADIDVIRLSDYLCDAESCRTYIDGTFIYRDAGHLSHEGSVFVANKFSLLEKILQNSR
jgi:hypothetical protein